MVEENNPNFKCGVCGSIEEWNEGLVCSKCAETEKEKKRYVA